MRQHVLGQIVLDEEWDECVDDGGNGKWAGLISEIRASGDILQPRSHFF